MTHRELLNKLPSPYREQAIENNTAEYLASSKYAKLHDILDNGFDWSDCRQEYNYWDAIYDRAVAGEFDDPSVTLPREDWEVLIEAAQKGICANKLIETIQSQLNQTK
jgi:hypothetical protein